MKAECTWGDGPDVLVVLDGTPIMSYEDSVNVSDGRTRLDKVPRDDEKLNWCTHGFIRHGSFDLTADQAEALARGLFLAARRARDLDQSIKEYDKKHEIKDLVAEIDAGKPMKIKRTRMRAPIKGNGEVDFDKAEKVSEKNEKI